MIPPKGFKRLKMTHNHSDQSGHIRGHPQSHESLENLTLTLPNAQGGIKFYSFKEKKVVKVIEDAVAIT